METLHQASALHVCGHCRKVLPAHAFYQNQQTGELDRMCKTCRKERSRLHRKQASPISTTLPYIPLTDLPPGELRHLLLHRAMQVVRERAGRRRLGN